MIKEQQQHYYNLPLVNNEQNSLKTLFLITINIKFKHNFKTLGILVLNKRIQNPSYELSHNLRGFSINLVL